MVKEFIAECYTAAKKFEWGTEIDDTEEGKTEYLKKFMDSQWHVGFAEDATILINCKNLNAIVLKEKKDGQK